jgi:hypothetical protein
MESQNADVAGSKKRGPHVVIASVPPERTRFQSKRSASGMSGTKNEYAYNRVVTHAKLYVEQSTPLGFGASMFEESIRKIDAEDKSGWPHDLGCGQCRCTTATTDVKDGWLWPGLRPSSSTAAARLAALRPSLPHNIAPQARARPTSYFRTLSYSRRKSL